MSHELDLAVALPGQPFIFAAPVVLVIALVAIVLFRKSRAKKRSRAMWAAASDELNIQFVANGSDMGAVARGRVNEHVVLITPTRKGRKKRVVTQYTVKFEAPEAPKFNMVKRIDTTTPIVDTGNPKFDAVVSVQTDQPELLSRFLTGPRRAAILRLLTYFPAAQITNREAHLFTVGIEEEQDKLVDSICHLVATAETFDRPAYTNDEINSATHEEPQAGSSPAQTVPQNGQHNHGDSDLLTEVRLDEVTVLNDLFNSGLDDAAMVARFEQVYQGRDVSWTGEVLRVGSTERGMQRVAAFVGSADGSNPESGRVVALTAVKPQPPVTEGDVVSFSGSLVKLDVAQRMFHVV